MKEMCCRRLTTADLPQLIPLHLRYKQEIGEEAPSAAALERLARAVEEERILFFGCEADGSLAGICSVTRGFSTFCYDVCGTFEDFYILPGARRQGMARCLAEYAWQHSGVSSLTVGCAPCDRAMYEAIGFRLKLGEMLAWEA